MFRMPDSAVTGRYDHAGGTDTPLREEGRDVGQRGLACDGPSRLGLSPHRPTQQERHERTARRRGHGEGVADRDGRGEADEREAHSKDAHDRASRPPRETSPPVRRRTLVPGHRFPPSHLGVRDVAPRYISRGWPAHAPRSNTHRPWRHRWVGWFTGVGRGGGARHVRLLRRRQLRAAQRAPAASRANRCTLVTKRSASARSCWADNVHCSLLPHGGRNTPLLCCTSQCRWLGALSISRNSR